VCRHPSPASRAWLHELLFGVGLVHVMRSFLTPWVDALLDSARRPPVTLDFDELDSGVRAQLGELEEARRFARLERYYAGRVDQCYTASATDARIVGRDPAGAAVAVVPNAVPRAATPTRDAAARSYDLLFVGNLSYAPNVDAVRWLCGAVRPLLRGASIAIVGSAPSEAVRRLGELDGVTVAGDVPEVGSWYARARVAVVPMRVGGGTRTKIPEALAHGRPVVSTSVGASGLPSGADRGVLVADRAETFAAACLGLLGDPERARRVAAAGWEHVAWVTDVREVVAAQTRAVLERHRSRT
jgi:glycosyltransferase involved in cell wall biosynthesis